MDVDGPARHHLLTLLTQLVEHLEVTLPDLDGRVRDGILVVIPAFNEAENVGAVVSRVPDRVCGLATTVVVVDDGSRDGTMDAAEAAGAVVARHLRNRGGGAALRTGYSLAIEAGAELGTGRPLTTSVDDETGRGAGTGALEPRMLVRSSSASDSRYSRSPAPTSIEPFERRSRRARSPSSTCARSSSTRPSS